MSLASNVFKNTFYQIVGKGLGLLFGLATVALMTRYLGREGFGFYTIAVSYLQFFGTLVDFGLQMATAQMLSRPGVNESRLFGVILLLRLVSAVLFLGLGAGLIWLMPYPLEVKVGAMIAVFSFFFIALQSVIIGLYQKHLAMAEVAMAEIAGRATLFFGVWLAIMGDYGFYAVMISVALGSAVNFLWLFIKSKNYLRYRLIWDSALAYEIWQVSWPLAITISLSLVYFRADTIILSFFRPADQVGLYGSAYKVLEIVTQFPYLFLGLMLPLMSNFYIVAKELYHKTIQRSFDFLSIIAVPMVFGTWCLSEKIMVFIAGDAFISAGGPLAILIVGAGLIYFGALFGYALVSAGLQKKMISIYLFDAIFSLIAYLLFIPLYGFWAAAFLTVVTEAIITFGAWRVLSKETKFVLKFGVFGKTVLSAILMSGTLIFLRQESLLTLLLVGVLIYFSSLYVFGGYRRSDVMELLGVKKV